MIGPMARLRADCKSHLKTQVSGDRRPPVPEALSSRVMVHLPVLRSAHHLVSEARRQQRKRQKQRQHRVLAQGSGGARVERRGPLQRGRGQRREGPRRDPPASLLARQVAKPSSLQTTKTLFV